MKIIETTKLDMMIAEELFGWKWYAFTSRPVRGTPGYPNKCRVRRFFPPLESLGDRWARWIESHPMSDAAGDEPLDYCYCSSNGPHTVPWVSSDLQQFRAVEVELERRGLTSRYVDFLHKTVGDSTAEILAATAEQKCMAALLAVGSKYVGIERVEETE